MTIGERIRYFREQSGFTQNQLANVSGLHPVTVRKYETNKMQPQPSQIEKLAAALNVSSNALTGLENSNLRFETIGDFMGIVIKLCNSHLIQINGERGDNDFLKPETVSIRFTDNPLLASLLKVSTGKSKTSDEASDIETLSFYITNPTILSELLKWEKINYLYLNALKQRGDTTNEILEATITTLTALKEKAELELQCSKIGFQS